MMSSTATVRSSSLSFLPLMTLASQKSKKRNFLVLQLYCQFIARVSIRSFFFPYLQASRALLEYFPSYVRTKYIASGLLAIFEYGTFVGRRARGGEKKAAQRGHMEISIGFPSNFKMEIIFLRLGAAAQRGRACR